MNNLAIFENQEIRRVYDEKTETWFFSVIDIIRILIQQPDYQAALAYLYHANHAWICNLRCNIGIMLG